MVVASVEPAARQGLRVTVSYTTRLDSNTLPASDLASLLLTNNRRDNLDGTRCAPGGRGNGDVPSYQDGR